MDDKILKVTINNYLILDALYDMAKRYSLSIDDIINIAIKHLLDIDKMMFQLRSNTYEL